MDAERWEAGPKFGSLDYVTILQLDLLGKTQGKCYGMPYVQAFIVFYQAMGLWKKRTNRDVPDTLGDT